MYKKFVFHPLKNRFGRKVNNWKTISLVTILAVSIGLLFGGVMIAFFSNNSVKQTMNDEVGQINASKTDQDKKELLSIAEKEKVVITIPTIPAYGIQLGIFTEKENVEMMKSNLAEKGINSFVLEEDGNFGLFSGIYGEEEQAKTAGIKLEGLGIEYFVKAMKLDERKVGLSQEKGEAVTEMIELLNTSLNNLDNHALEKWQRFLKSEELADIKEANSLLLNDGNLFLLSIWDYLRNIQ